MKNAKANTWGIELCVFMQVAYIWNLESKVFLFRFW